MRGASKLSRAIHSASPIMDSMGTTAIEYQQRVQQYLNPTFHHLLGTEVEENRRKVDDSHNEYTFQRQLTMDNQGKLNEAMEKHRDACEKRADVDKSHSSYMDYIQKEVNIHKEIDTLKSTISSLSLSLSLFPSPQRKHYWVFSSPFSTHLDESSNRNL